MNEIRNYKQKIKCLVVDDDEDYVLILEGLLEALPHFEFILHWEPKYAPALEKIVAGEYSVCFVDYFLGGQTGLEFISAASQADTVVPMILLTGADDPEVDFKASKAGAADFLSKDDLSSATLSRTLRYTLANAEKNHALRQKRAELGKAIELLSEQKELLQSALDNTKHGIAMFDARNRLIACNAQYLTIYGFSPDVVKPGVNIEEILRYSISLGNYIDLDAERFLKERMLQVSSHASSTYEQQLKDGRTIAVSHQPMAGGRSVTTCEDITGILADQRRLAELAREAALAEAESRAKAKFLSNMSHELRTPLNAIIGFGNSISEAKFGALGENYKTYGGFIADSGQNLLHTINQVLDMSLLSVREAALEESEFLLRGVVLEAVERYRKPLEAKQIDLNLRVQEDHLCLRGDSEKISRAIESVLDNAVKFCPPGGNVVVCAERDGAGEAVVSISDSGEGIPEDRISSLLLPFEQEESHYARTHQGAGLGLSIAMGLIRLHDGEMTVESGVGNGTTVKIALPAERVVTEGAASDSSRVA